MVPVVQCVRVLTQLVERGTRNTGYDRIFFIVKKGAQWLSCRVFDSRPRGCEF